MRDVAHHVPPLRCFAVVLLILGCCGIAPAAWHDQASTYRRPVRIELDEQKITGEEFVDVRFLANGSQLPDASDVHVTTVLGKPVSYKVIWPGPGDQIEVAFNPIKGLRDYCIYFGGKKPAAETPTDQLNHGGLLMEIKPLNQEMPASGAEMQTAFDRQKKVLSRRMISRAFLGNNLLGVFQPTMTKVSGQLFAPLDGVYVMAVAADDRGALFIDNQMRVFCRNPVGDTRFQERVQLTRGWHDFALYQVDLGGEYAFTVAWKRPDMDRFDTIGREFFGQVTQCYAGPLEEQNKPLTADMTATYLGETFFAMNYSQRYRFDVATSLPNPERIQVSWDFGDGQTATGRQVEHVFLNPDTYEVKVTSEIGGNSDTQKFRLMVDRDFEHISDPPTDELGLHAKLVATYDFSKLTPESLAWAVLMQTRAGSTDVASRAAMALAKLRTHPNRLTAQKAIEELQDDATKRKVAGQMRDIYAAVPADSDLQPWAAVQNANLLMYTIGDFPAAEQAIAPFASRDDSSKRTHAQAMLLAGRFEQARKLLEEMSVGASRQKAAALSGAMARTTEFYVEEKDSLGGEQAWDKWMTTFPADFLDGNAALMRVRLIEIRGQSDVAAKVAEAYANANTQSAYAPRLLDTASKLLEKTDKAKSDSLRKLLKERYPEDPLSQK